MLKKLHLLIVVLVFIIIGISTANAQNPPKKLPFKTFEPYDSVKKKFQPQLQDKETVVAVKIIDNPDSNMANWLLSVKPLNFYYDLGAESNLGLYTGLQLFYIETHNKYGFEVNYDHSFVVAAGGIHHLKNSFISAGFYKNYKVKEGVADERIITSINSFYIGTQKVVKKTGIKWPVRVLKYKGIRGGLINENIVYNQTRYSTGGLYFGFTIQERSNNYSQATINSELHHIDYSKLNILNFDFMYFPYIVNDIREKPGVAFRKSLPFGIRANVQKLYPIARKYQKGVRARIYGFTTKFECGYKFIQGVYVNVIVGLQIIRI